VNEMHSDRQKKSKAKRAGEYGFGLLIAIFGTVQFVPEVLAWPHKTVLAGTSIYSEQPIGPNIKPIMARSDELLRRSAIYSDGYGKRIFLTDGGWRWKLLSLQSLGAFGHTRPVSEAVIVNRTSISEDKVRNGLDLGGVRSLSSIIAHERTHGLIRERFGIISGWSVPTWLREGYCDYIARESSLNAQEVAALKQRREPHPAILYFEGRERVRIALETEGKTVEQLFASE
jgi:hypothetical protein